MNITASMRDALVDFVYDEARLLDEKNFDAWYELFTDDGLYWIPLSAEQQDGLNHVSLMYEDRLLLKLRIERLKQPRAFSQQPPSRSLHVLQRPHLDGAEPGCYRLRTPMIYTETRGDEQLMFAATVLHEIVEREGKLMMRCKRVNLLNADAALPSIQLFM